MLDEEGASPLLMHSSQAPWILSSFVSVVYGAPNHRRQNLLSFVLFSYLVRLRGHRNIPLLQPPHSPSSYETPRPPVSG